MKKTDEIKKGLECCAEYGNCSNGCPYNPIKDCGADLYSDALALIQQQGQQLAEKDARIAELERERDAAVSLLNGECYACLHSKDGEPCRTKEICKCCVYNEDAWGMDLDYNWQWRGVQEVE